MGEYREADGKGDKTRGKRKECRRSWREESREHMYRKRWRETSVKEPRNKGRKATQINSKEAEGKGQESVGGETQIRWTEGDRRQKVGELKKRKIEEEDRNELKTDWMREIRITEADRAAGRSILFEQRWRPRFMSTRNSDVAASSGKKGRKRKREKKRQKTQQCHVLLHHWIGLEDSGPTSDEGSHMPLGCIPFGQAQLASTHPCN